MDDMTVTCPTCRGAQEMMKLGGMSGKCNLCKGKGTILHRDLPVIKPIVPAENVTELVQQVMEAIPWSGTNAKLVTDAPVEPVQQPQPIHDTIKIERKKAIYKRKT